MPPPTSLGPERSGFRRADPHHRQIAAGEQAPGGPAHVVDGDRGDEAVAAVDIVDAACRRSGCREAGRRCRRR